MLKLTDIYDVFGDLSLLTNDGRKIPLDYEEMKKFDLDLKFGKMGEKFVEDLQNGNTMIDLKKEGKLKLIMGGDFNVSQMALIPRTELFKT